MNPSFVLDCSVALTWCIPDEASPKTWDLLDRLQTEFALVPSLWFIEVTNVLAKTERRGRLSLTQIEDFLIELNFLNLEIDYESSERAFSHLLPLCRNHGLTSYDAVYLDLAIRTGLPLASLDKDLRACAQLHGIAVLGL